MELICKKCGYRLNEPPSDASSWTCPVCAISNDIADGSSENWLDGLCHYEGPGHDLPVGGYCKIPRFAPESLAQAWLVATGEGVVAMTKTKELTKEDIIVGVTMNPEAIAAIIANYGEDFFQVREANGGPLMTLDQWQQKFHTNGLGLVAIRNMRLKLQGPGVHF